MSRPAPDQFRSQMLDLLSTSRIQALGLKESLVHEKSALEAQDTDTLNAAIQIKSQCVNELKSLDDKRSTMCSAAGFGPGPEQMEAVKAWCDQDALIANSWDHLLNLVADCNSLNLTNGAIIRVRQQQIRSSLSVLRGQSPEQDTYGSGTKGPVALAQRSLAEA